VLPTLTIPEISALLGVGIVLALMTSTPALFAAGPIIVYVFSPTWRRPALL